MQLEFFPSNTVVVWMEKKLYRDNSAKSFMFGYRGYLVRFIVIYSVIYSVIYNRGGGGGGGGGGSRGDRGCPSSCESGKI